MVWSTNLFFVGALIIGAVSQDNNGPYRGPPVVPVILPGGFLADTKEVAAAKEYFLNALAKTAAEVKDESPSNFYNTRTYQAPQLIVPQYETQPQSAVQAYQLQPGVPAYQPQSAVPIYQPQKAVFSYQAQQAYQPQSQQYTHTLPQSQSAPLYFPQVPQIATPVNDGQNYDDGEYRQEYQYIGNSQRTDPKVIPVILENGYIADTNEVNEAKANHFAAVAKAQEAVARAQQRTTGPQQYSTGYQIAGSAPTQ